MTSDYIMSDRLVTRTYHGLLPDGTFGIAILKTVERIFPLEPTIRYRKMTEAEIEAFWQKRKEAQNAKHQPATA